MFQPVDIQAVANADGLRTSAAGSNGAAAAHPLPYASAPVTWSILGVSGGASILVAYGWRALGFPRLAGPSWLGFLTVLAAMIQCGLLVMLALDLYFQWLRRQDLRLYREGRGGVWFNRLWPPGTGPSSAQPAEQESLVASLPAFVRVRLRGYLYLILPSFLTLPAFFAGLSRLTASPELLEDALNYFLPLGFLVLLAAVLALVSLFWIETWRFMFLEWLQLKTAAEPVKPTPPADPKKVSAAVTNAPTKPPAIPGYIDVPPSSDSPPSEANEENEYTWDDGPSGKER